MSNISKAVIFCMLLLLYACAPAEEPKDSVDLKAEEEAIREVIDNNINGLDQQDMELFASTIAHDDDLVIYGFSADACFVGWEAFEKAVKELFTLVKDSKLTLSDLKIHVTPDGKYAWATCLWDWRATMDGQAMQLSDGRWTMVFEKRETGWVMVHYHDSIGMAAAKEEEPEEAMMEEPAE